MADPATTTAGIVLLLMMMMGGGAKKKKRKRGCPPFEFNVAQIQLAIASAITSGMRGRETIAVVVATATWSIHPTTNRRIHWPPQPDAPKEVKCLWDLLLAQIDKYLKDNNIPPWPDCPPGLPDLNVAAQRCEVPPPPPPLPDDKVGPPEPDAPEPPPPPFDPSEWETPLDADYPTPGTMLQIMKPPTT